MGDGGKAGETRGSGKSIKEMKERSESEQGPNRNAAAFYCAHFSD